MTRVTSTADADLFSIPQTTTTVLVFIIVLTKMQNGELCVIELSLNVVCGRLAIDSVLKL